MAVIYSKLGGCLGVTAKLGPLARTDLWAGVKGLLERLMTHLGLGSSLEDPWGGLQGGGSEVAFPGDSAILLGSLGCPMTGECLRPCLTDLVRLLNWPAWGELLPSLWEGWALAWELLLPSLVGRRAVAWEELFPLPEGRWAIAWEELLPSLEGRWAVAWGELLPSPGGRWAIAGGELRRMPNWLPARVELLPSWGGRWVIAWGELLPSPEGRWAVAGRELLPSQNCFLPQKEGEQLPGENWGECLTSDCLLG